MIDADSACQVCKAWEVTIEGVGVGEGDRESSCSTAIRPLRKAASDSLRPERSRGGREEGLEDIKKN
jgi:hypothetical protein